MYCVYYNFIFSLVNFILLNKIILVIPSCWLLILVWSFMQNEMMNLQQDNERLQKIAASKSLGSSRSSLQTRDVVDRRYSTTDVPTNSGITRIPDMLAFLNVTSHVRVCTTLVFRYRYLSPHSYVLSSQFRQFKYPFVIIFVALVNNFIRSNSIWFLICFIACFYLCISYLNFR